MGRELSDVFKAKTRVGKRKVLDKFDISKEDKNKFLNGIESGSGESGGEASTIEYLDVRNLSAEVYEHVLYLAIIAKKERNIAPAMYAMALGSDTGKASAVGIDFNLKCSIDNLREITVRGLMEIVGIIEIVDAIPRITKEQFYSLE